METSGLHTVNDIRKLLMERKITADSYSRMVASLRTMAADSKQNGQFFSWTRSQNPDDR